MTAAGAPRFSANNAHFSVAYAIFIKIMGIFYKY